MYHTKHGHTCADYKFNYHWHSEQVSYNLLIHSSQRHRLDNHKPARVSYDILDTQVPNNAQTRAHTHMQTRPLKW